MIHVPIKVCRGLENIINTLKVVQKVAKNLLYLLHRGSYFGHLSTGLSMLETRSHFFAHAFEPKADGSGQSVNVSILLMPVPVVWKVCGF